MRILIVEIIIYYLNIFRSYASQIRLRCQLYDLYVNRAKGDY